MVSEGFALLGFVHCSPPSRFLPGMAGHIRLWGIAGDESLCVH